MMQPGEGIKRRQDVHYSKKRLPSLQNYAKLYPCAIWVRYRVPMRLLGLWYCNITKQVCTQDLCGESAGAGGTGECLGNCGMHFLNS